jgi:hypothetical protein
MQMQDAYIGNLRISNCLNFVDIVLFDDSIK